MLDKALLRKEILKKRNALTQSQKKVYSLSIMEQVLEFLVNRKIQNVFSYCATQSEVETRFLNQFLIDHHFFRLYLPKVHEKLINFYELQNITNDLEVGFYNILEPIESLKKANYNEPFIILVPGAVFDKSGNRLGYGKGFYDIFFTMQKPYLKLALCFECQIVDSIPIDPHDIPVDYLVTEKNIYKTKKFT